MGSTSALLPYPTYDVRSPRYWKVSWALPKVPRFSLGGRKKLHGGKARTPQLCFERIRLEVTDPRFAEAFCSMVEWRRSVVWRQCEGEHDLAPHWKRRDRLEHRINGVFVEIHRHPK